MFLAHARYIMNRVLMPHCDAQFPDSIPFFLHISRSLHRCIHEQQRLLRCALHIASLRGGEDIAEQKQDFGFLASDMDGMQRALEEDVRFLVGETSIREGKIVGWVSKFAALFLPVSLLATILSLSDPGYKRWAILGGLSVPFVLISIYSMFFWKPAYFKSLRSWSRDNSRFIDHYYAVVPIRWLKGQKNSLGKYRARTHWRRRAAHEHAYITACSSGFSFPTMSIQIETTLGIQHVEVFGACFQSLVERKRVKRQKSILW